MRRDRAELALSGQRTEGFSRVGFQHTALVRHQPGGVAQSFLAGMKHVVLRGRQSLVLRTGHKAWKMPDREWTTARTQFTVLLGNRFSVTWQVQVKPNPPAVLPLAEPPAGQPAPG